jgi:septum formation protein
VLLDQIGVPYAAMPVDLDETVRHGEDAVHYVRRMALEKALRARAATAHLPTLGADTVVVVDDEILGKPQNRTQGLDFLRLLSGRAHEVLSAVAIASTGSCVRVGRTRVWFRQLDDREMEAYWASGEPCDKAGGYAIQGAGAAFVTRIDGSYSGVMGLPLYETVELLKTIGIDVLLRDKS